MTGRPLHGKVTSRTTTTTTTTTTTNYFLLTIACDPAGVFSLKVHFNCNFPSVNKIEAMYGRSRVRQQWKSTLETLRGWPKTKKTAVKTHKRFFLEHWYWKINDICNGSGSLARTTRRLEKSSKLVTNVTQLSLLLILVYATFCFLFSSDIVLLIL